MTARSRAKIMEIHAGHNVEIVTYYPGSTDEDHPEEFQLECIDCGCCLFGLHADGSEAERVMVGVAYAKSVRSS